MEPDPAHLERMRDSLENARQEINIEPLDTHQADAVAATLRDRLVEFGGDPSDRSILTGAFAASWTSLQVAAAQLGPLPVQMGHRVLGYLWCEAEVFRRMLTGEIPVMTTAEMLGLDELRGRE